MTSAAGLQRAGGAAARFDVVAYPPAWRWAAGLLTVVARGSLLLTLAVILFSENPPTNPFKQIRLFAGLFAAPQLAAWCIARAFAARASVQQGLLILEERGDALEIPVDAIAGVERWRLPLPRGGFALRLRSGRLFPRAIEAGRAASFVEALVAAGASPSLRDGLAGPLGVFAEARLASPRRLLDNPVVKFVVFSLVPTLPVFRLHQFITYGGTFGEYYTFGLKAYLLGFGLWWASWSLNLLYFASAVRAVVEIVALAAAVAAPPYATATRRGLEVVQRILYYVGVPVWIALRLLA